ncbi:UNVERIFIED_CONTAM: hypothetical protein GTU68_052217 [Idotea baltica]|nr:hypothetical protein [Idotea baltica]
MTKILIPVKRVPDYETKVKIDPSGAGIIREGIKWIVNPFDEIAVEEALRLKESSLPDAELVVVSIGPEAAGEQIRTSLAMGADRGILVSTDGEVDSHVASRVLAKIFEKESPKIIIMGKQSIDSDANQTGQLLAAHLGLPQATFASKLEVDSAAGRANVVREVDGGLETISVGLPAIVTSDLRLNEPRYPSLPNIVKAKKKPLETIPFADLGVELEPRVKIRSLSLPPERAAGVKVASVEELVEKLKGEAKVL